MQELVLLGVLDEKEVSHGFLTYRYEIDQSAFVHFREQVAGARNFEALISRIVAEDARFLELAATLHYFIKNGYDRDQAEGEVLRVKPEKNYSLDEMQRAWLFLDELRSLGKQVSELH